MHQSVFCKENIFNIVNFVEDRAAWKVRCVINDENSDNPACCFSLRPETFIEDMNHS